MAEISFSDGALVGLVGGSSLFCGVVFAQIVAWRLLRVRREMAWLFALYLPPFFALLTVGAWPMAVVYGGFAAAFVMTFPALQAESPSLRILLELRRRGGTADEEELVRALTSESLVAERLRDLARDGLARPGATGLELRRPGRALGALFSIYRRLFRVDEANG